MSDRLSERPAVEVVRGTGEAARDLTATPGQTVGPFFGFALPYPGGDELVGRQRPGALKLSGVVYDGAGDPVPDALVEIWQADEQGQISRAPGSLSPDGWTFTGWGRAAVDRAGRFTFTTVAPGPTAPGRAAFFAVTVFARGLMNRLFTRCYLPEDPAALTADPLLHGLTDDRRRTLIATRDDAGHLAWDIHLQGEAETVFLTFPRHRP